MSAVPIQIVPAVAASERAGRGRGAAKPHPASLPEEVQSAFDYMPATLAGNLAGVCVVTLLFWSTTPKSVMLPWLAAFAAMWFGRAALARSFSRAEIRTMSEWARWRRWWNIGTLVSGALWGLTAWVFYFRGSGIQQTGLIITVYTFCIAVVPVLASQPRMFFAFGSLCFLPMIVRIASVGDVYSLQLAGILLLIFSLTSVLARSYRQALQRVMALKLRADELLVQLRIEKEAAVAARHEAEVANRAKTQFFTAASHDLRQPLHAMGLFAEALRQKVHDEEVAHLVNSINESVDALEGLFSELLDITRIDSGGVEVHPRHFSVGDIFRKVRLHFEPSAFEKGLSLRLRGNGHVILADPLLVERVVRNLVSNAIRYTQDGTVLVSARRRGHQVLLQVWDTGVGIGPDQQLRIFEEFYQVPRWGLVTDDQRKGLGLGLAIVKRLAALMDAPLTMRSEVGRGTVFTLVLPLGKAATSRPSTSSGKATPNLTLEGRQIVIVEDEPAVRSALEALLKGWGATIAAFDSAVDVMTWAAACDPAVVQPALLIVDYRLENGRTGSEVIDVLRSHFRQTIPSIVVTGSTMTGHDQEALDKDFHLLIKPVVPNKLRAMIAFKLAPRSM